MTKKTTVFMIAAGLVLGLAAARPTWAQSQRAERPLGVYVDIGYVNLNAPPRWIALGPELEWRTGKLITINPDVSIWFQDSFRSAVRLVPGMTVNFRINRIFLGGGVMRRISDWSMDTNAWFVPKFQIGYLTGPAKLALTVYVPGGNNDIVFGLTIGTRIGPRGSREPED
jgi:hypothetical protein